MPRTVKFQIYRYDPDKDAKPYMQDLTVELQDTDKMLLDELQRIKANVDDSMALILRCRASRTSKPRPVPSVCRTLRMTSARPCSNTAACSARRRCWTKASR